MLRHIAYVSWCRSRLDAALLSDILEVSIRNNARDDISGVLMYHDRLFFQVLEGETKVVEDCYDRICADRRHTAISQALDETVEHRSFPDWLMGYVGPDEIGAHSDGTLDSLNCLRADELTDLNKRGIALQFALSMFEQFSQR